MIWVCRIWQGEYRTTSIYGFVCVSQKKRIATCDGKIRNMLRNHAGGRLELQAKPCGDEVSSLHGSKTFHNLSVIEGPLDLGKMLLHFPAVVGSKFSPFYFAGIYQIQLDHIYIYIFIYYILLYIYICWFINGTYPRIPEGLVCTNTEVTGWLHTVRYLPVT